MSTFKMVVSEEASRKTPETLLRFEEAIGTLVLALFITFAAAAVTFVGAATALWAYPYPRGVLMILAAAAYNAAFGATPGLLIHYMARLVIGYQSIAFVAIVAQLTVVALALHDGRYAMDRIDDIAICARRDTAGICNISIERATAAELDVIRSRLKPLQPNWFLDEKN